MQKVPARRRPGILPTPKNYLRILIAIVALTAGAEAQNITGTIQIKKKLRKRRVTPSVSIYQRGTAVELGKDAEEDPLEFERSRVVIYLEGSSPTGINPANPASFRIQQLNRRFSPRFDCGPSGFNSFVPQHGSDLS